MEETKQSLVFFMSRTTFTLVVMAITLLKPPSLYVFFYINILLSRAIEQQVY
jgi:hypothetical protein